MAIMMGYPARGSGVIDANLGRISSQHSLEVYVTKPVFSFYIKLLPDVTFSFSS